MMADVVFRKMLIELYDQNRYSTLIRVSLKEISKMGHHGEIAHIVQDLDYFEVFNDGDLLVDILVRVCRAETEELDNLLNILKRMCCNTEYMFVYTLELLATVYGLLGEELVDEEFRRSSVGGGGTIAEDEDGRHQVNAHRSVLLIRRRKLQRLRQELEHAAVWQKREVSTTTTTITTTTITTTTITTTTITTTTTTTTPLSLRLSLCLFLFTHCMHPTLSDPTSTLTAFFSSARFG